jgi:outer membrane usher protein
MSHRGYRQGIATDVLIILLVFSLSVFFRTCFHQPLQQEEQQTIQPAERQTSQPADIVVETPVPESSPLPVEPAQPVVSQPEPSTPNVPVAPQPEQPAPQVTGPEPPSQPEVEPTLVPQPPKTPSVTIKKMIPDPPTLFTPTVMTQEDYDLFYAPQATETESEEEDPFADFFVSGEDAVTYEDGLYYLSLYINDEYVGDIETKFANPEKLLNATDLSSYLSSTLKTEANERLFAGNPQYLSLEDLQARGMPTTFDSAAFALHMTVDYNDMTVRILSVASGSSSRRDRYTMSGATVLDPAKFSWVASMSLYGALTYPSDFSALTSQTGTLYINNALGFLGWGVNFSTSLFSTSPYFSLGTWTAFHDFPESSQRLTIGSVGTNLSARTTSEMSIDANMGFTVEKSYSYGSGSALRNQFQYSIEVIEPSTVKIYMNGEEESNVVFQRRLTAGTYRLKDFVFTQGANKIRIDIIPESRPDDISTYYVDTSYDSRLLGRGDTVYGYGASIPRGNSTTYTGSAFHFKNPLKDTYLSYYPQYFTARYWQSVGLTDTFSLSLDLSATPGVFSGTFNGVWATMIGTTQFQGTTRFSEAYDVPLFNGTITERFNDTVMKNLGSLSLSMGLVSPATASSSFSSSDIPLTLTGSFSYSGTGLLTKLRYSLSGTTTYINGNAYPTWSISGTTGFRLFKGLAISAALTVSASDSDQPWNPEVTATISGGYSFSSKVSSSASTTYTTNSETLTSVGLSYRPTDTDSISLSMSGFRLDKPLNHSLYGVWSHTGKFSSLTFRQQASSSYQTLTTSATLSTAIAFADGVFGMARSVSNNFLLIKPVGELRHSQISVARSMDNSPQVVPSYLGAGLFTNITPYQENNVVVYSGGSDAYSISTSFMYQFTPSGRQAYVARIDLPPTFTVTGVITHADGTVYDQYSSPIYRVTKGENGEDVLEIDNDFYLFTDQEGRFVINSMPSGEYSFDLQVNDSTWYAVRFTIPEMSDKKLRAIEYRTISDAGPYDAEGLPDYDQTITLEVEKQETEEELYSMLFPVME